MRLTLLCSDLLEHNLPSGTNTIVKEWARCKLNCLLVFCEQQTCLSVVQLMDLKKNIYQLVGTQYIYIVLL